MFYFSNLIFKNKPMSGFFGAISKNSCVLPVFYGTDYHSHLGTKRAGLAFYSAGDGFQRAIHSLEDGYFRTKFENDLVNFSGNAGIGVISDTEAQPIVANSHLGKFAISTVSKIINAIALEDEFLQESPYLFGNQPGKCEPHRTGGDAHSRWGRFCFRNRKCVP
jgi:amidophosphoribosyltransferase